MTSPGGKARTAHLATKTTTNKTYKVNYSFMNILLYNVKAALDEDISNTARCYISAYLDEIVT